MSIQHKRIPFEIQILNGLYSHTNSWFTFQMVKLFSLFVEVLFSLSSMCLSEYSFECGFFFVYRCGHIYLLSLYSLSLFFRVNFHHRSEKYAKNDQTSNKSSALWKKIIMCVVTYECSVFISNGMLFCTRFAFWYFYRITRVSCCSRRKFRLKCYNGRWMSNDARPHKIRVALWIDGDSSLLIQFNLRNDVILIDVYLVAASLWFSWGKNQDTSKLNWRQRVNWTQNSTHRNVEEIFFLYISILRVYACYVYCVTCSWMCVSWIKRNEHQWIPYKPITQLLRHFSEQNKR